MEVKILQQLKKIAKLLNEAIQLYKEQPLEVLTSNSITSLQLQINNILENG